MTLKTFVWLAAGHFLVPGLHAAQICDALTAPSDFKAGFAGFGNKVMAKIGAPHHSGLDTFVTPEKSSLVTAVFRYGKFRHPMKNEWVDVYADLCKDKLVFLGKVKSDKKGEVNFKVNKETFPKFGHYQFWFRVKADNSLARARVGYFAKDTRFVIFDLDGTITPNNKEMTRAVIRKIFWGSYDPKIRPGAKEATLNRKTQGYEIIYLTSRIYWLSRMTKEWNKAKGLAKGFFVHPRTFSGFLPGQGRVGKFKKRKIKEILDLGFKIDFAYGNTEVDFWAYESAGIAKAKILKVGADYAKELGALGESFMPHAQQILSEDSI